MTTSPSSSCSTAAAFWALAEREVEVAVVEAGLGGRYDATAVVESAITVLTNVGLEHTRWLGPTVRDIATEKLAVLRPETTLALGASLDPEALAVARAVAGEQRARIVQVSSGGPAAWSTASVSAPACASTATPASSAVPAFQRRNFALARVAAEAYLADAGIAVREDAVRQAAPAADVPGRMQVVADDPLTVLDGAHNPDAARALVESLSGLLDGRPLALVMGVLEDKDAASMLAALLPLCARAWFTAPPSARALSPAALQSLARQQGFEQTVCEPHPRRALAQAQEWARAQPDPTAVLATGSVYLVGDLLAYCAERGEAAPGNAVTTGWRGGGDERRRPLGARDGGCRRPDRGARDPAVLRRRLRGGPGSFVSHPGAHAPRWWHLPRPRPGFPRSGDQEGFRAHGWKYASPSADRHFARKCRLLPSECLNSAPP